MSNEQSPPSLDLATHRKEYTLRGLRRSELDETPYHQLELWLEEAVQASVAEPTAMTLATVSAKGQPSARIVLLKGLGPNGLRFFSNYESRKAKELTENPSAALCFFWPELQRQVRVEGTVERLPKEESRAYFESRPRGSRLGAWASAQSQEINNRAALESSLDSVEERFAEGDVPLPSFWGGFLLRPEAFEFWQGGPRRLHDRFRYSAAEADRWRVSRLAP